MLLGKEMIEDIVVLLRNEYPNWNGFHHPKFEKDEIEYKQAAVEKAHELLAEGELRKLQVEGNFDEIISRIKKVGLASKNLLFNRVPSSGDLSILEQPNLNKPEFCGAFIDLLYSPDPSQERLERYLSFIKAQALPNKWTFSTYFLFICHPETEMFVKPEAMKRFLEFLGKNKEIQFKGTPSGEVYATIKQISYQLKEEMKEYGPRDMVDVQSVIYLIHTLVNNDILAKEKRAKFLKLFREFANTYLSSPEGKEHAALYDKARTQGRRNMDKILEAKECNEDITDQVILGVLPYVGTDQNKKGGLFISPAGVFKTDARRRLGSLGFVKPEDWPSVAQAILKFVRSCDESPEQLYEACDEFSSSPYSKGFQAGTLTPILNALHPDQFVLINNKSREVLNYFAEKSYSQSIADYPKANETAWSLLMEISGDIRDISRTDLPITDLFDMFSHWYVAIRPREPSEPIFKQSRSTNSDATEEDNLASEKLVRPLQPTYLLNQLAADIYKDTTTIESWLQSINRKGQAIIYGPPGTGKTFVAEHIARHLVSGGNGFVDLVQFHPAYAYEDFIQGIRPVSEDGNLKYRLVKGRFREFCQRAEGKGVCVLIIDEINRANLARVFGELMYLLEYRDKEIPLASGESLCIPEKVRIIGTMNTADRSIALVDHALRRRFAFLELRPDFEVLKRYHAMGGTDFPIESLVQVLTNLNKEINEPNFELGISYFLRKNLRKEIEGIWKMEIEPYLDECIFDNRKSADKFCWENVRPALGL